jgi:hypothetical protein
LRPAAYCKSQNLLVVLIYRRFFQIAEAIPLSLVNGSIIRNSISVRRLGWRNCDSGRDNFWLNALKRLAGAR